VATLADLVVAIGVDNSGVDKGTQAAESKFKRFADRVTKIATVAGAAAGAALVAGLLKAMEFDRAQARMAAQLGDPVLAEQLGRVAGDVYARGFGQSVDDAFSAVRAITASGLVPSGDLAAIEALTVAVQAYADAWGVDVVEAAQIASSLIGVGLARDATHAMDLITAASRKVPPALVDTLLEAANEYGQFFRTLGLSGEQTFSLLASQAEKGQWGIDKVGDAVKEFTIRATDMSTATQEAFAELDMDAQTMSNRLLAGGETARQAFQEILAGLLAIKDPTDQATTALALFGTPLEDLNVAEIPAFLESLAAAQNGLGDVSGAAQEAAEVLERSASQKLESFKRRAKEALVDQIEKAMPVLERIGDWAINNMGILTGLGAVIITLTGLVWGIRGAVAAWNAIQVAWAAITKVVAAAQWLLNAALAANPIGLIIIAVIALIAGIVLLWQNCETFRNIVIAVWDAVWGAIKAVVDWIVDTAWPAVKGAFGKWLDLVKSVYGWVFEWLGKIVTFVGSLPGKIRDKAKGLFDGVVAAAKGGINKVIELWNRLDIGMSITVPSWVPVVGGRTFSIPDLFPDIPYLAQGGIVRATPGGTLAVLGEGGQDEAVIPLPRGLRDLTASRRASTPGGEVRVIVVGGDREAVDYLRRLDRQYGVVS